MATNSELRLCSTTSVSGLIIFARDDNGVISISADKTNDTHLVLILRFIALTISKTGRSRKTIYQ